MMPFNNYVTAGCTIFNSELMEGNVRAITKDRGIHPLATMSVQKFLAIQQLLRYSNLDQSQHIFIPKRLKSLTTSEFQNDILCTSVRSTSPSSFGLGIKTTRLDLNKYCGLY